MCASMCVDRGLSATLNRSKLYCVLSGQEPGSDCASEEEGDDDEEEEEEVCSTERVGVDQRYDEHIDEAAEEEGLKRYREARANEMFPDEVDTPLDMSARIRSVLPLLCNMRTKYASTVTFRLEGKLRKMSSELNSCHI